MSSPAVARVNELPDRRKPRRDWLLPLILTLAIQFIGAIYTYGRLVERVDNIRDEVREVKQQIERLREQQRGRQ